MYPADGREAHRQQEQLGKEQQRDSGGSEARQGRE